MFDILPLAGMLFSLLMVLIIGGFILLVPLSKRLGQLLELRMEERRQALEGGVAPSHGDLGLLREMVESLQNEVSMLVERQQFMERLLESGERDRDERDRDERDRGVRDRGESEAPERARRPGGGGVSGAGGA